MYLYSSRSFLAYYTILERVLETFKHPSKTTLELMFPISSSEKSASIYTCIRMINTKYIVEMLIFVIMSLYYRIMTFID